MKKYSFFIILGLLCGLSACEDLNRFPQTSISPELFFNTEEDLSLYINGLLSLPDRNSYLNDQSTDNAATTGAVEMKTIMVGTPTAQNINSGWDWGRLRNINYFLNNYQKAAVSADVKNHYAGLAKYYRAEFYMGKVKRYSDVPWFSKTLNPGDEELYKTQDSRAMVMDSVMADLEFASNNVREKVRTGTPGKWAAKMLYARIALYEGTYRKYHSELNLQSTANKFLEKAAAVAGEIRSSGKFSIYNTGKPAQDYATLFNSQDILNNTEVILTNVFDQTKNRTQNVNTGVFGEYEQSPARDLIQTYLMKDGSRFTDVAGYQQFSFVKEFENRDPRMSQTIVYPGWVRQPDLLPYVQRLNKNFTGYHQLKGYLNNTDGTIINGVDFPVYRYAEALLIYAEALAELGTLTQAHLDQSVNLLRKRANMPDLSLTVSNANPDAVQAQKYPNLSGANKGVILEIRRERRVEFAFENSRYDDLMRWQAGKLLTNIPEGMYFAGLGKYDLTGDGIEDIILIDKSSSIPVEAQKAKNSLGVTLIYYKAGAIGEDVTVYLKNGLAGGALVTETAPRKFEEPKYYYRPVPQQQILLNPSLKQIFGW
ncbi:RagB/SusD family nutrient uptake outer membrane protein [Dyadobacter psychrotolerans]|uniref:RagB/SusD family nutrient uptake outer membrane protein n=1 Tax=Dyadobacter psychrotolerans TaxID=2541721 RepID=A0A4R5DI13_9BACT|nr:RagB/SusD family nutrient uptake outer membrane protein [Dyadobacter psychrotolerans]TDE11571.1 RagB/SusD family nutrient uptake outer membrane protein [Dyadobacter psychrotolerans]